MWSAPAILPGLLLALPFPTAACAEQAAGFAPIYHFLERHCGDCHVQGVADGPWSLNTPPNERRYADCLNYPESAQLACANHRQLVEAPALGIPAWIRPTDAAASEPYAQACVPAVSFHIGHSLAEPPTLQECARFLRWIEAGAPWD
ncbi:MAG: hypothetical protein AAGE43_19115 [Pseudomonadota bacterium]